MDGIGKWKETCSQEFSWVVNVKQDDLKEVMDIKDSQKGMEGCEKYLEMKL